MSKIATKTIQERLKIHMALFTLLTWLLSGFDLNRAGDLPITRVVVIIYVGLLMMWAFIVDARRPNSQADTVIESARLLYLDLERLFKKLATSTPKRDVESIQDELLRLKAQLEGLNLTDDPVEE